MGTGAGKCCPCAAKGSLNLPTEAVHLWTHEWFCLFLHFLLCANLLLCAAPHHQSSQAAPSLALCLCLFTHLFLFNFSQTHLPLYVRVVHSPVIQIMAQSCYQQSQRFQVSQFALDFPRFQSSKHALCCVKGVSPIVISDVLAIVFLHA